MCILCTVQIRIMGDTPQIFELPTLAEVCDVPEPEAQASTSSKSPVLAGYQHPPPPWDPHLHSWEANHGPARFYPLLHQTHPARMAPMCSEPQLEAPPAVSVLHTSCPGPMPSPVPLAAGSLPSKSQVPWQWPQAPPRASSSPGSASASSAAIASDLSKAGEVPDGSASGVVRSDPSVILEDMKAGASVSAAAVIDRALNACRRRVLETRRTRYLQCLPCFSVFASAFS